MAQIDIRRALFKAGGLSLFIKVSSMVMTLGFVSGLSFLMDKTAYGQLATLISVVFVAASIGSLGHQSLMTREVSKACSKEDLELSSALMRWSTRSVFLASMIVGAGVGGAYAFGDYSVAFCIAVFVLIVLVSVNQSWAGVALAQGRYVWALAPRDLFWRAGILLGAVVLYMINGRVLFSQIALLAIIVYIVLLVWQRQQLNINVLGRVTLDGAQKFALRRSSINLTIVSFTGVFLNTLDMVVVGSFLSSDLAAEYFPANRLAFATAFVALALQSVVGPNIAMALEDGDKHRAQKVLTFATTVSLFAALVAGSCVIFGFPFYQKLFATATLQTEHALTILVVSQMVMASLGFGNIVLVMSGQEKVVRWLNLGSVVFATLLFAWAIQTNSIVSIAIVVAVAGISMKIVSALFAWRLVGLTPFSFSRTGV